MTCGTQTLLFTGVFESLMGIVVVVFAILSVIADTYDFEIWIAVLVALFIIVAGCVAIFGSRPNVSGQSYGN